MRPIIVADRSVAGRGQGPSRCRPSSSEGGRALQLRSLGEPGDPSLPALLEVRRLEFAELPKTISGKIRRVELRARAQRSSEREFREEDMPELRVVARPTSPA